MPKISITAYVVVGLMAALALVSWTTYYWYSEYQKLNTAHVTLNRDYEYAKNNVVSCNENIKKQNDSIEEWKLAKQEMDQRMSKLAFQLGDMSSRHSREIQILLSTKVPIECEGAMAWLRVKSGEFKK